MPLLGHLPAESVLVIWPPSLPLRCSSRSRS